MKRKTFINRLTLGTGSIVLAPSLGLLQGCEYKPQIRTSLSRSDLSLLNEIGETILPTTTASPGAKMAEIGEYMLTMYNDCMTEEDQTLLLNGINEIHSRSAQSFSKSFIEASPEQRLQLLETLQTESIHHNEEMQGKENSLPHYFNIVKGLTISGYFSSEIGMTKARRYLPIPGKFEACIPYNQGDRPWAT